MDDGGAGKKITIKSAISRLRLRNIFRKKEDGDHDNKKIFNYETRSLSDTTSSDLSPIKGEEDDSYGDKFNVYFASSFLPHISIAKKDDLDVLVENPSIHCQAFVEAGEMEVPPSRPQKARTRKQPSRDQSSPSNLESVIVHRPTIPTNAFANRLEATNTTLITVVQQRPTAVPTNAPIEPQAKAATKAKQQLISFRNELIESVEHSQSDFNLMLKRIASDAKGTSLKDRLAERIEKSLLTKSQKTEDVNESNIENDLKKTKAPKTMNDIKSYLSHLRQSRVGVGTHRGTAADKPSASEESSSSGNAGTKNYQELFKSKMGSLAKTLSSVAPNVKHATSAIQSSFELQIQMCSLLVCTDDMLDPMEHEPIFVSNSFLSSPNSWISMDEDSDSVSKLTMPFYTSELSMGTMSFDEYEPTVIAVDTLRRTRRKSFDL